MALSGLKLKIFVPVCRIFSLRQKHGFVALINKLTLPARSALDRPALSRKRFPFARASLGSATPARPDCSFLSGAGLPSFTGVL